MAKWKGCTGHGVMGAGVRERQSPALPGTALPAPRCAHQPGRMQTLGVQLRRRA